MTFPDLTDEEQLLVEAVARFVEERVRPNVTELERQGAYPEALVAEMKALGLFGMAVPVAFGGLGLRVPALAAMMEVLARGWATLAAYVNSHGTVAYAIATYGTDDQKARFLPGLASGDHRGSLCLTEPGGGSDLQAIRGAVVAQDGGYGLSASKTYVTNGGRATLFLTLARLPQADATARPRFGMFLVERSRPGVSQTTTFHKTAFGLVDTVQIEMDAVPLTATDLLGGDEGKGFAQLMEVLEIGRIAIAASAVGLAANALSEALRYSAERVTFGVPINRHQAIQLKLANMATRLVTARLITREAARIKQDGGRCDMISAMAKMHASDEALAVAHEAVVVHGGAGYIQDYTVERLHREALLYTIGEGTNDINRLVISRRMQGDEEMAWLGLLP
ncbi:MAG: acyl-CoA dehydrogenase family protein [Fuscovulum sp.]|nr:acyl-CoA dehydrogenase family protein [Fuscovulum sp.]